MARRVLAVMVLCLLVAAALLVAPFLGRHRLLPASVPSPPALDRIDFVRVPPGRAACFDYAAVESHSQVARIQVATGGKPGAPLTLDLRAPGWRQSVPLAGGYPDGSTLSADLRPPSHSVLARVCIANRGSRAVRLYASADRTQSRSIASVDGRSAKASIWFSLSERKPVRYISRLSTTFQRMSAFRPGIVGPWLFWLLFVGVLLAVPAAVLWAYVRSVAEDDEDTAARSPSST